MPRTPSLRDDRLVLPAVATTHSHAFQRALRGRAQRSRGIEGSGASFWSWRGLMYALAERMTPEDLYAVARYAFVELATRGVTTVGEFHYLHHDRGGVPYAERTLLSDVVIRAALDAGVRIALLRVVYRRAGADRALEPAQRRFVDRSLEAAFEDVDELRARYASEPRVRIGLAAHSVRALDADELRLVARRADALKLVLHAHVAEQEREVDACLHEHGRRPVELLHELGALSSRFTAVHATHLAPHEARLIGEARAHVSVCRTTERDLGDGLPDLATLRAHGARFSTGVDSHAASDPFEEARAMELDERTRARAREVTFDAAAIVEALTGAAHASLGFDPEALDDEIELDLKDPAIDALVERRDLAAMMDAIAWQAHGGAVRRVRVEGREIVRDGRHVDYDAARQSYEAALRRLLA